MPDGTQTRPAPTDAWPEHFAHHRCGANCPMCTYDFAADDIDWGTSCPARGQVSNAYLWRSDQVRGYTIVIYTSRHVAEPPELDEEEAPASGATPLPWAGGYPSAAPVAEPHWPTGGAATTGAESDVAVSVAGIVTLLYGMIPTAVGQGPARTATRDCVIGDSDGGRWLVKAHPAGTSLDAERQAMTLGRIPVPIMRQTLDSNRVPESPARRCERIDPQHAVSRWPPLQRIYRCRAHNSSTTRGTRSPPGSVPMAQSRHTRQPA
ncbi:hypothetical protein [Streptomyces sp. NPDC004528]|uniref:hypothetical protein n=1 Tax=Streptomyces sp. NPDC004528 TaxID=3154550 RepID=UPI00339FFB52